MPVKKNKKIDSGTFNLIQKEVSLKKNVKKEINWYSVLNILFLVVMVSFGIASYTFGLFMKQGLDLKKQELVAYANNNVNIPVKTEIKTKINTLNDRFTIYEDVNDQNFDFNKFYNDFKQLYPSAQVGKISYTTDSETIDLEIVISNDGYNELPKFLEALKSNNRFREAIIKSIAFLTSETSISQNSNVALRVTLEVPKVSEKENG